MHLGQIFVFGRIENYRPSASRGGRRNKCWQRASPLTSRPSSDIYSRRLAGSIIFFYQWAQEGLRSKGARDTPREPVSSGFSEHLSAPKGATEVFLA